jgi:hypothetical protein
MRSRINLYSTGIALTRHAEVDEGQVKSRPIAGSVATNKATTARVAVFIVVIGRMG